MTSLALGIDIGGTKIAVGLVRPSGEVVARSASVTPARAGGEAILTEAVRLGRNLIISIKGDGDVIAVGVGSAGVIDPQTGRVISATESLKNWAGTEVTRTLEAAFCLATVTDNDVHAHAVGEAFVGAGRGYGTVVVAAIGTGIGGAIVIEGIPQTGTRGVAGHLGHIPIDVAADFQCPCGRWGHLEGISSGSGLYQLYKRRGGDASVRDARDIVARVTDDPIAGEAVVTSANALGRALGGIANYIDPGVVIVAGGLLKAGGLWWRSLDFGFRQTLLPILNDVPLVNAQLGDDAAIIGAAKRAFASQGVSI